MSARTDPDEEDQFADDTARLLPGPSSPPSHLRPHPGGASPLQDGQVVGVDGMAEFEAAGKMVTAILKPVSITMLLVIFIVVTLEDKNVLVENYWKAYLVYEEKAGDSTAEKLGGSLLNAMVFIAVILVTTFAFFILYKLRCMKILYGWIIFSTVSLLAMLGGYLLYLILVAFSVRIDWITFGLLMWNFAAVGVLSIFWRAPVIITQGYLVIISAILAWTFTKMADWTMWMLLAALVIYDIAVVLTPKGPLKMLVELAQQRNEPIPGLIYDARPSTLDYQPAPTNHWNSPSQPPPPTTTTTTTAPPPLHPHPSNHHTCSPPISMPANPRATPPADPHPYLSSGQPPRQPVAGPPATLLSSAEPEVSRATTITEDEYEDEEEDERNIKLGLGDFVFYSVLIARAASFEFLTLATCFVAILTGLCLTLLLLGIFRKALPALPVSISLGIFFYFLARVILLPYVIHTSGSLLLL